MFKDPLGETMGLWHTVSGHPRISDIEGLVDGKSLSLGMDRETSRNTFVLAKKPNPESQTDKLKIKNGRISCAVYLEKEAVFNLVFRVNDGASEYYMARVDSRPNGSSGFLKATNTHNWQYIAQPNTSVLDSCWHHVDIILNESEFILMINNDEVTRVNDRTIPGKGRVGMFNEVESVFVNNFVVQA